MWKLDKLQNETLVVMTVERLSRLPIIYSNLFGGKENFRVEDETRKNNKTLFDGVECNSVFS